jgi:hypothetical protein
MSGTVFAFEVRLFVFLAKQTLDSACRAFGDDFADDPMMLPSVTRSRRKARFLATKIERIPEAANRSQRQVVGAKLWPRYATEATGRGQAVLSADGNGGLAPTGWTAFLHGAGRCFCSDRSI